MTRKEEQQVAILLAALVERYGAMRTIRERVQSTCLWTFGGLVGAGGWLLQREPDLTAAERNIALIGLAVAMTVLRFWYLADLEKGFAGQQKVAARIERALGLYDASAFNNYGEAVYPASWLDAGKRTGNGGFFKSTYALLYVGCATLVAVLSLA